MDFLDRDNRSNDMLCRAVEQTLADAGYGYEVLPSDFSAFVERQRSGQYALAFWPMHLASGDDVKTDGDVRFANEQEGFAKEAADRFSSYLDRTNGDSTTANSGLLSGNEIYLFDTREALLEKVNAFRAKLAEDFSMKFSPISMDVLSEARGV